MKVRGLWYDGPALDPYRHGPSARGGRHHGKWVIRRDPRDRRTTFFQDPDTHQWHTLRWAGLPSEGEIPSFSDGRVTELLKSAKQAGLKPKSDRELLPLLLKLIGGLVPVSAWPSQMPKSKRSEHAREVLQGQAAQEDRPRMAGDGDIPGAQSGAVVPLRWEERADAVAEAVDSDRRRRRQEAMLGKKSAIPPRLGEGIRRHSPFALDCVALEKPVTDPSEDKDTS